MESNGPNDSGARDDMQLYVWRMFEVTFMTDVAHLDVVFFFCFQRISLFKIYLL